MSYGGAPESAKGPERFPSLAQRIADDGTIWGGWLATPSPTVRDAYLHAGFDYVGIDTQHGSIDALGAVTLMDPLQHTQFPAVVRVASNDFARIGMAFDGGAEGVIVPMVETAEQARAAVAASSFPAQGGARSCGPIRADLSPSPDQLGARATLLVMVETTRGLEHVDEIAAVPGLGGIYIGPGDLSISLGLDPYAGFMTDQLREPVARIAEACAANGVLLGAHVLDASSGHRFEDWGVRLMSVGGDVALVRAAAIRSRQELTGRDMERD